MEKTIFPLIAQVFLFSFFPFCFLLIKSNFRRTLFYTYLGVVLGFGGFLGQIWSIQVVDGVTISGGNIAYAGFIMTALIFVIMEREIAILRNIIYLVIIVNTFVYLLFNSLESLLGNPATLNTHSISPDVFASSIYILISGEVLIIFELLFFMVFLEFSKRFTNRIVFAVPIVLFLYIFVMCLDGILFPVLNYSLFADLRAVVSGGVKNKIILGLSFAPFIVFILLFYRRRLEDYLSVRAGVGDFGKMTSEDLSRIIEEQMVSIKESEERYRSLVEGQSDLVCRFRPDTTLTFVNGAFARFFGRAPEELVGEKLVLFWDAEEAHRFRGLLPSFSPHSANQRREQRTVRIDGEARWHIWSYHAFFDEDGSLRSIQAIGTDVTQQKLMESQLQHAQKMDAVGQLTGGVAHDLNNVLGIISMNLSMLGEEVANSPENSGHVDVMQKTVARGADLTRKLLDFSRKEAWAVKPVLVNGFIENMEGLIAKSLTPAITLKLTLSDNPWAVEIDPGEFEDALLNLALNARDAMPDGGALTIETANAVIDHDGADRNAEVSAGEYVMVSVSDSGTGMPPETIKRAFEPFFTTKEVGKGTGLGLSMVYGFARRSGGHVGIESEPGAGTTVRLYLPRTLKVADGVVSSPSEKAEIRGGDETILVVDDEVELVDAAVSFLNSLGYRAISAANGVEALEILGQGAVDLLFADMVMPGGMDGYRLAMEARNVQPELKVLLASGFTPRRGRLLSGERRMASELSKSLLRKPYNIFELAAAVRRTLDGKS